MALNNQFQRITLTQLLPMAKMHGRIVGYLLLVLVVSCGGSGVATDSTGSASSAESGSAGSLGSSGSSGASGSNGGAGGDGSDYSVAANWVCLPDAESVCETGLDVTVDNADGSSESQTFTPASDPVIDCFYVYPTVSQQQTQYADLADSPEVQAITKAQAGRLTARCRMFAPIYRQETSYALNHPGLFATSEDYPMADVAAAWAYYMKNYNAGRGVVLVGHSQGTVLLQQLIAQQIDGTATQNLLVAAFLAGDPSLAVPPGAALGGTFAHIPVCTASAQIGCVYVWSSYLAGDASGPPIFGGARSDGFDSACVNPAAPAGGVGALQFYDQGIEYLGELTGTCVSNGSANTLIVTVAPGPFAAQITAGLQANEVAPGWGVHPEDIDLVQGNILDVLNAEIATWQAQH